MGTWGGGGEGVVQEVESPDFRSPQVGVSASEYSLLNYNTVSTNRTAVFHGGIYTPTLSSRLILL